MGTVQSTMERGLLLQICLLAVSLAVTFSLPQTNGKANPKKHVGCYFGAWAFYRPGDGKFDIDDINPHLCTHVYYGFANIDNSTWEVYPYDPWYDLAETDTDMGCVPDPLNCKYDSYRRMVALKNINPELVVMLSIGGWNAGSGAFSMMAADPAKRKIFIDSLIPYTLKFGFDGIDMDWEYPGTNPGSDPVNDKPHFTLFSQELGARCKENNLFFSFAASPDPIKAERAFEVEKIMQVYDWINIMTYDYHGAWDNYTGHNSPLYGRWEEGFTGHPNKDFDAYDTVDWYISKGCPKEKIVMGMATYGRGWSLYNNEWNGLYCPAYDGSPKMPYTRQYGIIGYNEILQFFYNATISDEVLEICPDCKPGYDQWEHVVDGCYKSPYMYHANLWFGYEDKIGISYKSQFINWKGLKGGMIWSLETDDFRGLFDHEGSNYTPYPLLHEINRVLDSGETLDPSNQLGSANENSGCGGKPKAPMCDSFDYTTPPILTTIPHNPTTDTKPPAPTTTKAPAPTTTQGGGDCDNLGCNGQDDMVPFPGNCHWYYHCMYDENGFCTVEQFDCGDWVFDPNVSACVWPELPGNEDLCV